MLVSFFTKCYSHLQRQDTPRCCLGQLGSKSAGFGRLPEIWSQSLYLSEREVFERGWKKGLADSQKCTEIAQRHHFSLFSPPAFSQRAADREDDTYSKNKRQTIDYIRDSWNKNPLCSQGILHTLRQIGCRKRMSHCQKNPCCTATSLFMWY